MIGPCASGMAVRKEDQRTLPNSTFIPEDFLFAFEIAALFIPGFPKDADDAVHFKIQKKPGKRKKILLFFQVQVLS